MSLSFPSAPTVGQIYQGWTWNGSAWDPNYATTMVQKFNGRQGNVTFGPTDNSTGNRVFLARYTVASPVASIDFPNVFSAAYNDYEIDYAGAQLSAAGGIYGRTGSGAFDANPNYSYTYAYSASASASLGQANGGGAVGSGLITTGQDPTAAYASNGKILVKNANVTTQYKYFIFDTAAQNAALGIVRSMGVFHYTAAVAITHFQFVLTAGNFTAGRFSVYGVMP